MPLFSSRNSRRLMLLTALDVARMALRERQRRRLREQRIDTARAWAIDHARDLMPFLEAPRRRRGLRLVLPVVAVFGAIAAIVGFLVARSGADHAAAEHAPELFDQESAEREAERERRPRAA